MTARRIDEMRNLGPRMASMLAEIDVHDEAELREMGAVEAFIRLRVTTAHRTSLNALYAMHAALHECDWRSLDQATKAALRRSVGERRA